jgi:IS5 family transposase
MVGLHLIKHMDSVSDEAVCARFLDSPSVPLFCGESHVQHALPRDRSSMTRWRQRNRAARLELLLAETLGATNRPVPGGKVVLGARSRPGNPCDGHTLAAQIAQTERITGVTIERASVDPGDRGHDAQDRRSGEPHQSRVFLSGQRRGVTPTIRREIRRRADIEPVIGQMKADGHLGRNVLAGAAGDAITLVLAAAGHTLRLLRAWQIRLLAFLLSLLAISATAPPLPSPQLAARLN